MKHETRALRKTSGPNDTGWADAHKRAMSNGVWHHGKPHLTHERAMVLMLRGWLAYADAHAESYESDIRDDCVLGEHWRTIGEGIRGLLNGETGRLDPGTIDSLIHDLIGGE